MSRRPSPEKHRTIVAAARTLFVERGYLAVSMDEVARTAEVSKRTVYARFENKEALFAAVLEAEKASPPSADASPPFDPARDLEAQLVDMVLSRLRDLFARDRFRLVRMIVGETLRDPALGKRFGTELDAHSELLVPWLREAHAQGALVVDDPSRVSTLFWRGALGALFWPALLRGQIPRNAARRELASEWAAIFLARLRPRDA